MIKECVKHYRIGPSTCKKSFPLYFPDSFRLYFYLTFYHWDFPRMAPNWSRHWSKSFLPISASPVQTIRDIRSSSWALMALKLRTKGFEDRGRPRKYFCKEHSDKIFSKNGPKFNFRGNVHTPFLFARVEYCLWLLNAVPVFTKLNLSIVIIDEEDEN